MNNTPKFDVLDFIMRYEGEEMPEEEVINGFQYLVDTGMAWTLQGHYGRMASALINQGLVHPVRKEMMN